MNHIDEVVALEKRSNTGVTYHAAQLILHSSGRLHGEDVQLARIAELQEQVETLTRALSVEKAGPVGDDNAGAALAQSAHGDAIHINGTEAGRSIIYVHPPIPDGVDTVYLHPERGRVPVGDDNILCDLCQERPETHSDAEGIGFCDQCWNEAIAETAEARS